MSYRVLKSGRHRRARDPRAQRAIALIDMRVRELRDTKRQAQGLTCLVFSMDATPA